MGQEKYTKKQVERAGEKLRNSDLISDKEEFSKVMDVLSYWRFSHEAPLERAFEILQEEVAKDEKKPIYGKRLKRHVSISAKLRRFEKMSLTNMQDIGGCRAVEDKSISGYVILVIKIKDDGGEVESHVFAPEEAQVAEQDYMKQEKKYAGRENVSVAMVSTNALGEIKRAYPNYFADSTYFITLLHLIRAAHI